jgi:hypothetical protein
VPGWVTPRQMGHWVLLDKPVSARGVHDVLSRTLWERPMSCIAVNQQLET